ncbi:MAG: hypothetical protein ACREUW_16740 [Burkholderiales bacterium]
MAPTRALVDQSRGNGLRAGNVLANRPNQTLFLLASWALVASAHASYGQMRLDGLGLLLAFGLTVAYGVIVDLALFAKLFRYRTALVIGVIVALAVVFLLLSLVASPSERAGFFKGAPGGAALVLLVVTSAVFLPFIVVAPFGQYHALRHGRRWPGWITAWMVLQLALLPAFLVLAGTEQYFWKQEQAAGQAEGRDTRAGGLGGILERAERRHERIWGTGWASPWLQKPPAGFYPRPSGWIYGLATSMDASAMVAANEPLNESDRIALRALMEQHLLTYGVPNINAKLIWDALEPGGFSRVLAPHGVREVGVVSEEVIPVLLERLEKYGEVRLCPGGRMMDADRAVLNALVLEKGRAWNVEKRDYEMRPDWDGYQQRVERLCRAPEQQTS